MDILFVKQLTIKTIIGIYKWEKFIKQKLIFDIKIAIKNKKSFISNEIKNCIDYTDVIDVVSNYVKNNKFSLIETVAENVALLLLNSFHSDWIKIRIVKNGFFSSQAQVGILITRKNKN